MGKSIIAKIGIYFLCVLVFALGAIAINYEWTYTACTGCEDAVTSLNQTGDNITADTFSGSLNCNNIFGNTTDICTGSTDTNETTRVDALESANVTTNSRIDNINLTTAYFYNITDSTVDGNDLGNYTEGHASCAANFTGTHMCTVNEMLDTIIYKDPASITEWAGTAWISNGPPGYLADANDCIGWNSASNTDLGSFWDFDYAGTDDGSGWLTNCEVKKALACCKPW